MDINPIDTTITEEEVSNQNQINRDYIDNTLFILPNNDGEANRSIQILNALNAPYIHVSQQKWGATLNQEWSLIDLTLFSKVKNVAIFEIPGIAEKEGDKILFEEKIKEKNLNLDIIDHHYYEWVNRYSPKSSIEQLCEKIGWQLNDTDKAIAVNDRSYIPGLKSMGLSIEEIRRVRTFDLVAQGKKISDIKRQIVKSKILIDQLVKSKIGNLWIIENIKLDRAILLQEIALRSEDGLTQVFESRNLKLGFSGNPKVCDLLLNMNFKEKGFPHPYYNYGGGDGTVSKFWGFKPKNSNHPFSTKFSQDILDTIVNKLKDLDIL